MNDNVIYTQSDSGLNHFFAKIYGLVGMGIGLSAFVSYLMLYVFTDNLIASYSNPMIYYGAIILELILVFTASSAARKNTPAALPLFLLYSALNGFTLSFIIATYAQAVVLQAFLSAMVLFFVMALIGVFVKRDLSGIAKAAMAMLIGVIIASVLNLFFANGMMSYIISLLSVIIFSGLIAYDNQLIKRVYQSTGGHTTDGWAISMALNLYLDFINLFLSLIRVFSSND
ncbi:Bax inhibitor-1/YccA family protein [Streptococcus sciuri]|uniref:Bax inhibitor-1/YccA family protein n=1 Tax=Streptococcus sciuri TaxID=2973939 RepID=A0ABT2F8N6_9STRE|nr:Bax inhibitor-1/YccA family protein [Streptococcus sciuri]MCS4488841.1 Bax inhibitor-1/YccA family protein [Streptococcus sciuri]